MISIHPNATSDVDSCLAQIKKHKCKVGLALNPDQSHAILLPYLDQLDFVLFMSVFPGFGGQKIIKEVLAKIEIMRKIVDDYYNKTGKKILIEIDGGVNQSNLMTVLNTGIDIIVMGSAVFNDQSTTSNFTSLNNEITKHLSKK